MNDNTEQRMQELSKKRLKNDNWQLQEALSGFVDIVESREKETSFDTLEVDPLYYAFRLVCDASKIKAVSLDTILKNNNKSFDVDHLAKLSRINYREVILTGQWWKSDNGPLLAYHAEDGRPIALIPKSPASYIVHDVVKHTRQKIDAEIAGMLKPNAIMLYRPLPDKKMKFVDMAKFALEGSWKRDLVKVLIFSFIGAVIGMMVPKVTQLVFDVYIPGGEIPQLAQVGVLLIGFLIGKSIFELTRAFAVLRIEGKTENSVQSAIWDRLLGLPAGFFRGYTAGDLVMRAFGITEIRETISGIMACTLMTSVFSLVYLIQIVRYGRELAVYAIIMVALLMLFSFLMVRVQVKYEGEYLDSTNKTSGLVLQLIQGIAKFRVAGAENRAFKQWADRFSYSQKINIHREKLLTITTTVTTVAPLVFSMIFYYMVIATGMELNTGEFIAFITVFGMFSSAMIDLIDVIMQVNSIKPTYDMIKPIIETMPEYNDEQAEPGVLSGAVRLENVSFRYEDDSPLVLDGVSINVKPGEYVGIVGPSGSGKSTLLRMLLGFESPEAGQIYYDDKDLAEISVRSVRRQLGVVMQNAQLLSGDIFSNIAGANFKLTRGDVMEAVKMAGMEEDINEMPMGLNTIVSEGAATLSGGQRQRLLIARAIVNKPKILYFDEATSALDNVTQKTVQNSLDGMDSTRIVIAHRLSTIINCDRIIVLDKGKIVQEGTYDELIAADGVFSGMADRQLI